jgi:hydrogenase/urease accessory protein HupE
VPGGIDLELEVPLEHLSETASFASGTPSNAELLAARPAFEQKLREQITARTPGGPCRMQADEPRVVERETPAVTVMLHFYCPEGTVVLRNAWRLDADPASQSLCAIDGEGWVFRRGLEERDVGVPATLGRTLRSFVTLGMKHVATGFDHVCFVIALLVRAALESRGKKFTAQLGAVATLVTGFTIGHSATLVAAGLGWMTLPSRPVESLIALSLVFMGLENVFRDRLRARLFIVAAFGMVHGLGFASALAETALPRRGTVLALLCFNLGVELAQLALVVSVFPLLSVLARSNAYRARVLFPVSLAIAFAGSVWFVKRATGLQFLPWFGT